MHIGTAERLGVDDLTGCGLHQRWSAEEDRALFLDDDGLITHRRHIRPTRGARTHDHSDLGETERTHARLVVEDAAEVLAIWKHLILQGQKCATRIHQVDAGQAILQGHFLRAKMLLYGDREIGAPFDRRIVGDNQHFLTLDPADAGDQTCTRCRTLIHQPDRAGAQRWR